MERAGLGRSCVPMCSSVAVAGTATLRSSLQPFPMPWRTLTDADVLAEFTPAEQTTLRNIQGATDALPRILGDTAGEFIGAMNAAGYATNNDGSVPDQLRRHIIARARWGWLIAFPALKALQTAERKAAADAAEKVLEAVAKRQAGALEPPGGAQAAGNWNSENRLIPRTHPVPPASQQASPNITQPPYANPNAPQDSP